MFTIDPEFEKMLPPLASDVFQQLESDILARGCHDPLVVWQGKLLDGHNRYEICKAHDIPYEIRNIDLPDRNAAIVWILSHQLCRRDLNTAQRASLALKFKDHITQMAKENQRQSLGPGSKGQAQSPDLKPISTRQELAKIAHVGIKTIDHMAFIEQHGSPELRQSLATNAISISKAYQKIREEQNLPVRLSGDDEFNGVKTALAMKLKVIKELKAKKSKLTAEVKGITVTIRERYQECAQLRQEIKDRKGKKI